MKKKIGRCAERCLCSRDWRCSSLPAALARFLMPFSSLISHPQLSNSSNKSFMLCCALICGFKIYLHTVACFPGRQTVCFTKWTWLPLINGFPNRSIRLIYISSPRKFFKEFYHSHFFLYLEEKRTERELSLIYF